MHISELKFHALENGDSSSFHIKLLRKVNMLIDRKCLHIVKANKSCKESEERRAENLL